jgi:hypothetical protein
LIGIAILSQCSAVFVNVLGAQELIPPAYVAWRSGTTNDVVEPARRAGNRFMGPSKVLRIRDLEFLEQSAGARKPSIRIVVEPARQCWNFRTIYGG